MNLILIYGPPASGKLAIAKELATLTGYPLLDNHQVTDYLLQLFPRSVPEFEDPRAKLGRKIRLLLFEAAASNGVSLVTTFAPLADGAHDFTRSIQQALDGAGAKLCLVQLLPTRQALENRVVGKSRKGGKVQTVERLRELFTLYPVMFEAYPDIKHLVIDNSNMQPNEVASLICRHFGINQAS